MRHIVGAIANEGDINSRYIGHIKLYDDYSTVELPQGMPKELLQQFGKTRVLNKQIANELYGCGTIRQRTSGNDLVEKAVAMVVVMTVETVVKIASVVNEMANVVSVNLTIKTTALLMNVVAEIVNVNPYLTAP